LQLRELEAALMRAFEESKTNCVILIDKLDEGYEPDSTGIGFIAGILYALSDLESVFEHLKLLPF
jgi:hypothetical protein